MKRKILCIVLSLVLVLAMMPSVAFAIDNMGTGNTFDLAKGDISISIDANGTKTVTSTNVTLGNATPTNVNSEQIIINQSDNSASTTNVITIDVASGTNAKIVLAGVNIDVSSQSKAALSITGDGNVEISLYENNTLKSGDGHAGLEKKNSGSLTIDTYDYIDICRLVATGGSKGAGIGGGNDGDASDITINGGNVKAYGSSGGAGIGGGGSEGNASDITISGGIVTASSELYGAGIGGGSGGAGKNIKISYGIGTLNATSQEGAGIGGGWTGKGTNITTTANSDVDGAQTHYAVTGQPGLDKRVLIGPAEGHEVLRWNGDENRHWMECPIENCLYRTTYMDHVCCESTAECSTCIECGYVASNTDCIGGIATIAGIAKFGKKLTINTKNITGIQQNESEEKSFSYVWKRESAEENSEDIVRVGTEDETNTNMNMSSNSQVIATGSDYVLGTDDIGKRILCEVSYNDLNGKLIAKLYAPVGKADKTETPTEFDAIAVSYNEINFTSNDLYQYSIDGGKTWSDSNRFEGLNASTTYFATVRYKETETHKPSAAAECKEIKTHSIPTSNHNWNFKPDEESSSGTGSAIADAKISTAFSDGKLTTIGELDFDTCSKLIKTAVDSKAKEIVVDTSTTKILKPQPIGTETVMTIPFDALMEACDSEFDGDVTFRTDSAWISFDKVALEEIKEQNKESEGGDFKLTVETVGAGNEHVYLKIKLVTPRGNTVNFGGGNVKINIPIPLGLQDKKVSCIYIDNKGHLTRMNGIRKASSEYICTTNHFSTYAIMEESKVDKLIEEQVKAVNDVLEDVKIMASSVKTKKGNIQITAKIGEGDLKALTDKGYTVKYKYYRSTKKASGYKAMMEGTGTTYINTSGEKGTRYYYKVRVMIYNEDELVGKTALKQSSYAVRTWKK